MNTTQGLAVATALMLSAGVACATTYDPGARSKSSTSALPWRNAPMETDSFAGVVSGAPDRTWASNPGYTPPTGDTFADPARRDPIDRPPPGGDVGTIEANPAEGLVPIPEPNVSSMLLAGLGAIGLLGIRRRLN
jgi:hypothetical protein